jgi:hypothetical protein
LRRNSRRWLRQRPSLRLPWPEAGHGQARIQERGRGWGNLGGLPSRGRKACRPRCTTLPPIRFPSTSTTSRAI